MVTKKKEKNKCLYLRNETCTVIRSRIPEKQILEYCKGLYIACRYFKKKGKPRRPY